MLFCKAIDESSNGWLACTHEEARSNRVLAQRRGFIKFHRVQPS
jgi:hypothetical protein